MAHVIQPISRLLVANRGEIARRINRTARAMGISTVAIYADGDANAPFVLEADSAIALQGKSTGETYLDVAKVLTLPNAAGPTRSTRVTVSCQKIRLLLKQSLMPA